MKLTAKRMDEKSRAEPGGDLSLEQAVSAKVDWEFISDMATRQGTTCQAKRVLTAAAWGVLPTPLWLARHGWEAEVVCAICGRAQDLRHAMAGCDSME